MGQRSQIYIYYNVYSINNEHHEGFVARYFHWNYAERMVSRARSIIEKLKDEYLEHKYLFGTREGIKKLNRFGDINFDMRDMCFSVNILEESKVSCGDYDKEFVFGQPNNNGQLFIEVTNYGIKYCFIEHYTQTKPMNAEQYMKWEFSKEDWDTPDEYTSEEAIAYTKRNIDFINSVAKLMTEDEVNEFINRDYETILNKT